MRDTLGDRNSGNDRVFYVWLLTSDRNSLAEQVLSAVPFFYWRIGDGSHVNRMPSPLLNLNAPLHPVLSSASRKLLQWAAFDPLTTPVRASSRSYQANALDIERIKLEQTITYLQSAPVDSGGPSLTSDERNTAVARLTLRKTLLGGLMKNGHTARFGQQAQLEEERVRSRNFETLRQLAEKTGTYVEPLTFAGNSKEFAIVWFPIGTKQPETGTDTHSLYKLLNVRDPWSDADLLHWSGLSYQRALDENGSLLPSGEIGAPTSVVPLAVYSLDYSRMPLLLADFRDEHHVRRHEMLQRSITELTGGIIGVSHFGNWYYYAAAMLYHTVWARRGTASNQAERLDCYARFRTRLALDTQLDPALHSALAARADSLIVNPLSPGLLRSLATAQAHSDQLQRAAQDGTLLAKLNKERRAELAYFAESPSRQAAESAFHTASFGTYTNRVRPEQFELSRLDRDRRIVRQLEFLDEATRNGTNPEVAYDRSHIARSIHELDDLLPGLDSQPVRDHAVATLSRVRSLVSSTILQTECMELLLAVNTNQAVASVVISR